MANLFDRIQMGWIEDIDWLFPKRNQALRVP
jgi:hypothetical protein